MGLKWGIIGCGKIAGKFAKDLSNVEGNELYAVASRSIEKAQSFAKEHGAMQAYGNYQLLCEDKNVDIIYVATPHNSHLEFGLMVLEHGKHLLCEKPLAVNQKQVKQLIAIAAKNKVFMMEALWARFNPSIREVAIKVQDGEIGDVKYINADFYFNANFDPAHRLFNPSLAGGSLLDIGVYPLFLSYLILGYPQSITSNALLHENGVDLQTSAILEYENAHSVLSFGLSTKSDMLGCINGNLGSFQIHNRWHEAQGYTQIQNGDRKIYERPTKGYGYTYEIMECSKCINEGRLQSELWSHQDSLNLIEMCDIIRNQNGIIYPFE